MFCPRCSQQQASDSIRFCSRCGFPLSVVAGLLAHDGILTEAVVKVEEDRPSPRQKGVRQGTVLLFVGLVVSFIMSLLSVLVIGSPELFVPITAGPFYLSGILRIIYAYIFERAARGEGQAPGRVQLGTLERDHPLPSIQSTPAASLGARRVNTTEMVVPPRVTEHTTKLLDKE